GLQGRLRQLIFELCDLARRCKLFGGALQLESFLGNLIASRLGLLFRLEGCGVGGLGSGTLAGVEDWDLQGETDGRVVGLKPSIVEVVIIDGGKPRILRREVERRVGSAMLARSSHRLR